MPEVNADDGVRLHCVIDDFREPWLRDHKTAVLLHHGFAKNLDFWSPFVPAVARRHKVIRHDVRGAGMSSLPPADAPWNVDRLVQDALNSCDALNIEKVHHAGMESGGIVGLAFAAAHPDRTLSVACFNTPHRSRESEERMHSFFGSYHETIDNLGVEGWLRGLRGRSGSKAGSDFAEWVIKQGGATPPSVIKGWHHIFERTSEIVAEVAPHVDAPVLLAAGGNLNDFVTNFGCEPEAMNLFRSKLRNAHEVVYIPDVGAAVQLKAPDACAAAYLKFLNSL